LTLNRGVITGGRAQKLWMLIARYLLSSQKATEFKVSIVFDGMYLCMYIHVCVDIHINMYANKQIFTWTHTYGYICIYIYLNMYLQIYIYTYMYIYTYVHRSKEYRGWAYR
jgi:hypothetical protein